MNVGSIRDAGGIVAHKITIRPDSKHDREKFLMACSCGVEGRFLTQDEAKQYAQVHMAHYGLAQDCLTVLDSPEGQQKAVSIPPYAKGGAVASAPSQVPPYVKK